MAAGDMPYTGVVPSGTVTFLFTDIEGSTKRWEAYPQAMGAALARHDEILRGAIEAQGGGYVFKTVGDAFCAAFATTMQAMTAALGAQRALHDEQWPEETGPVRVRMALHLGAAEERGGDYFGQPVNRVARLLSAGHGGQVLLSLAAQELVRDNLPSGVDLRDLGEHRLKDLTRPERIFELVVQGLPSEFAPLKTLDSRPNNLPRQSTALIGREKEVEAVCALLGREGQAGDVVTPVTLVTLTGPGGTGKTRLGLQVGAEMLDDFRDGVWFVELAALVDAGLVVPTVAATLGVKEAGGTPIIETLKSYLREKEMLLILDNFEQVTNAAQQVRELLGACPRVKVLVTSRIPLHLRGEREYAVPPLGVPDTRAGHMPPLDRLTQYEAVRLFIERATDVKSDFEVNNENAPAVAEICARLDGLPLAIELAAARVRMLPPQALLTRLSQRLKVLTGGARDLPARQQTLRNAIEWSYDLLEEGEKQLLRRLAVFQGGRTLEAIESICNSEGDLRVDVLDGVQSLVDNSLLRQEEAAGEPRLVMLETMHEFAREKLGECGEADELTSRHAHYFQALAQEGDPQLRGPQEREWLERFEAEHDNFRAALQWALDKANGELACQLSGNLGWFWYLRGYLSEGRKWLEEALALDDSASPYSRAMALNSLGCLCCPLGDMDSAKPVLEESVQLFREVDNRWGVAEALNNLGIASAIQGHYEQARVIWEESLALRRQVGNKQDVAGSLSNLGEGARAQGDYERATDFYKESLPIARSSGAKTIVVSVLSNLGQVEQHQNHHERAKAFFREGLALCWEMNLTYFLSAYFPGLAGVATWQGDNERAARLFGATDALVEVIGLVIEPQDRVTYDRNQAAAHAQLTEEEWHAAYQEGRTMSVEQAVEYALSED